MCCFCFYGIGSGGNLSPRAQLFREISRDVANLGGVEVVGQQTTAVADSVKGLKIAHTYMEITHHFITLKRRAISGKAVSGDL